MGDIEAIARLVQLIKDQDGVVARRQALACGVDSAYVRRQLRSGAWLSVQPGVYITHNGPLSWRQRAWCAVLDAAPAALSHASSVRATMRLQEEGRRAEPIHIAVADGRHVTSRDGVVVHHRATFEADVQANLSPPRIRLEEAVLDVAAGARNDIEVVAVLSEAVGGRRTTAARLLDAAQRRTRLRRRALIAAILADIRDGTCSALEYAYLTKVERPHGLPKPVRQSEIRVGRRGFRDMEHPDFGLVVELDGRAFHDSVADRDRDMERDLDAAVESDLDTRRLGWGQASVRPCVTAAKLARIFARRGWTGTPTACSSPKCAVGNQSC
ncbi:type IV toxin-antitoxin system AbiEi family antitoxin domain-containing protein [Gordonia sp. (in: high G+C Gram-positive bacteria)]|uniref:type IV toxin-antitoxin system AbiEi family antitoxin domain-containing protein n=1 Tax=Gordonia sp. (in: high G+C Gram-positive bacteria) TaxID=84139 RepID=UPI003F9A2C35